MVNVPAGYDPLLKQMEQGTGIPYNVLAAQAEAESGFNPKAVSPTGAEGWLQFEPQTYQSVASAAGVSPNSEFDPSSEAKAYIVFMNQLLKQEGGDLKKALEAYNAGPGNLSAGANYASGILSAAGQADVKVTGSGVQQATTDAIHIPGLPSFSVGSVVKDAINAVLSMFGLGSVQDMVERLGLILLGGALVLLGVHMLSSGGGSPVTYSSETVEDEAGNKRVVRKTKTPVSSHTATTKSAAAGSTSKLAGEAAEAAIAA